MVLIGRYVAIAADNDGSTDQQGQLTMHNYMRMVLQMIYLPSKSIDVKKLFVLQTLV